MKRKFCLLSIFFFLLLAVCLVQEVAAQQLSDVSKANDFIKRNAAKIGLSAIDLQNYRISDMYVDKLSGATMIYLQQTYKGIDVMNAIQSLAVKNDELFSVAGKRVDKIELKANSKDAKASLTAADAVRYAAKHLNITAPSLIHVLKENSNKNEIEFDDLGISSVNVRSKLLWVIDSTSSVKLSWQVVIQPKNRHEYWLINMNALDGSFINKLNLNVNCDWTVPKNFHATQNINATEPAPNYDDYYFGSNGINSAKYNVIPFPAESPIHSGGTPALKTNPWELAGVSNNATTLKWNDNGTTTFDSTRGNNVLAREDMDDNNGAGKGAHSSTAIPDLTFNFTPDFSQAPTVTVNQNFAITNLFYWNNIMHDISYQYGFDEVSGNFQENNLSRGGSGNDYVFADAQDGASILDAQHTNNANFATDADGLNPRMQMYLFNAVANLLVNQPVSFAGQKDAVESDFSTKNKIAAKGPITSNVVLYNDNVNGTTHGACVAAANASALNGKIALLKRGTCGFTTKVKNAQTAGAIAALVWDSIPGEAPFIMGGTDNTITIPAFMISSEVGDSMMNLIKGGTTVNVTMSGIMRDGDLDNGVISHEYTHGISNRLTGGPSQAGCLFNAEQMGEGWSDYMAIMVTTDWSTATINDGSKAHPIGNYVVGYPITGPGIRVHPYSTDMTIDPWTYDMLKTQTGGEVHTVGEIWTTVLWDMTWNIIQQDGINKNIYNANGAGGNSVAIKLVLEGLKLQNCSPGFIDGRNAILKADTLLYGGKYSCLIWNAFAKRGMGINASQGSSDNYRDQVTDYNVPSAAIIVKTANKDSALQLETIQYTLKAKCQCAAISNYKIVDTLASNVTYVSGGTYNSSNRTVTFSGIHLSARDSASFSFVTKVNAATYSAPVIHLNETVASTTISGDWSNTSTTLDKFKVKSTFKHSSPYSFYISEADSTVLANLTTTAAYALSGNATLSFWHYYNTEAGWDGAWVEISTNNGTTWSDLESYITLNGYQSNIAKASGGTQGHGFSGNSGGFIQTIVDLSSFAGKSVKIRFNFSSDEGGVVDGWYLDDIVLKSEAGVYNLAKLFDGSSVEQGKSNANTLIKDGTLPVVWGEFTAAKQGNTALLKWQTLQEYNTAKFIVERSTDGVNFTQLVSVPAAGNSLSARSYQYIDNIPLNGTDYYRVQQIDKDGKATATPVRSLDFLLNHIVIIKPNPAKDNISITVSGNDKLLKIYLINAKGQQLSSYEMKGQYLPINLPNLAPGVYYIKISGDGTNSTHKLVIQ